MIRHEFKASKNAREYKRRWDEFVKHETFPYRFSFFERLKFKLRMFFTRPKPGIWERESQFNLDIKEYFESRKNK